jgi:hypothetical protein
MTPTIGPVNTEWISGRAACKILGCASNALLRASLLGHVKTLAEPGVPIRYHRGDCERLAAQKAGAAPRDGRGRAPQARRKAPSREARHEG